MHGDLRSCGVKLEHTSFDRIAGRPCHQCQPGEICFMSGQETKPHCVTPKDPKDPRGCGGWCSGPNELCRRLDNITVHCVDDSGEWHD